MTRGSNPFNMAALDMSLDEIGKANTASSFDKGRGRGRGRGRGGGRGRGTDRGRGRGRGQGRGGTMNTTNNTSRMRSNRGNSMNSYRRNTNTTIRGQPVKRGSRDIRRERGRNISNIETTGKVIVQNLGTHVTSDDVKEIFEKAGTITQAFVKFDKNGKSTGTAEVVYAKKDDARKAQRDLNGAQIDGISVNVALSTQSSTVLSNSSPGGRGQISERFNNMSRGRRPRGSNFGRSDDNNNNNSNNYPFNNNKNPLDRINNK